MTKEGHNCNPSPDPTTSKAAEPAPYLFKSHFSEYATIPEQPSPGQGDAPSTPSCSSDPHDKFHSPTPTSTPHPLSISPSYDEEVCSRNSHIPSPVNSEPEARPTPSSSSFQAGSESVPLDHVSPSSSPSHKISMSRLSSRDMDPENSAFLTEKTQQKPIPHNTPPCKTSHSTPEVHAITPTLSPGRTEIKKELTERTYLRISREEPELNNLIKRWEWLFSSIKPTSQLCFTCHRHA